MKEKIKNKYNLANGFLKDRYQSNIIYKKDQLLI